VCFKNFIGKPPGDDAKLADLSLKPGTKIMMMGTREEVLENILQPPDSSQSDVVNDFDIEEDEIAIQNRFDFLYNCCGHCQITMHFYYDFVIFGAYIRILFDNRFLL